MDERDKKRIQANSRELIHNILVNDIQDHLYERGVLTQDNVEALLNDKSPQKAARRLVVTILPRKGPEAFGEFLEALREAEYGYLADKLEQTVVEDVNAGCGDNKCKHKHNQLLRNSRNLEDELEELREKVKEVKIEAEAVQGVKVKVDSLEHENFLLRKQLSFYEEKESKAAISPTKKGHHPIVRKSGSTGTFSFSSSQKANDPASRKQRHSYSYDPTSSHSRHSSTSSHHSRSSMEGKQFVPYSERNYDVTPLYDEVDDQFLDDLLDDLDGHYDPGPTFEENEDYDDVDGLTGNGDDDDDSAKSNSACASARGVHVQKRIKSPKLSEESDRELNALLTDDIIGYFHTGKKKKPVDLNITFAQYILVMRRAVDSMSVKHGALIEQISRQVDVSAGWDDMIATLRAIFEDFLADDFHHSSLFWGRTVAMYTISGYIARKCARREKDVQELREFLTDFVNMRLESKIRSIGGWDTFCEFIEAGGDNFPAIFPAPMIQAAITAHTNHSSGARNKTDNMLSTM